ncbi:MAG: hypothetical protein RL634_2096 [Bacteroidota bacterium]|jgi:hypothetical protein
MAFPLTAEIKLENSVSITEIFIYFAFQSTFYITEH